MPDEAGLTTSVCQPIISAINHHANEEHSQQERTQQHEKTVTLSLFGGGGGGYQDNNAENGRNARGSLVCKFQVTHL